ncbi:unnamed protein product [Blepharisma stoltei]|uniref:Uncharacterized protein n=1 Tax=Blepharisma stoltei TaxID=1481888 RepID=A0AAU9IQY5_9CILI|nr:unnamed protein product [Blepharisma stoltei]
MLKNGFLFLVLANIILGLRTKITQTAPELEESSESAEIEVSSDSYSTDTVEIGVIIDEEAGTVCTNCITIDEFEALISGEAIADINQIYDTEETEQPSEEETEPEEESTSESEEVVPGEEETISGLPSVADNVYATSDVPTGIPVENCLKETLAAVSWTNDITHLRVYHAHDGIIEEWCEDGYGWFSTGYFTIGKTVSAIAWGDTNIRVYVGDGKNIVEYCYSGGNGWYKGAFEVEGVTSSVTGWEDEGNLIFKLYVVNAEGGIEEYTYENGWGTLFDMSSQ